MTDGMTPMLLLCVQNWVIHMELQQDKLSLDLVLVLCGYAKWDAWEVRVNYHIVYTLELVIHWDVHMHKMLE